MHFFFALESIHEPLLLLSHTLCTYNTKVYNVAILRTEAYLTITMRRLVTAIHCHYPAGIDWVAPTFTVVTFWCHKSLQ